MATFTGAERARCVFWFEETKSATQVQRNFRTKYRKEPPSRPTLYSPGTRILFRPDVLCAMPSHPVGHVFLTLQWNSLGRASFQVHESQRDLRLGKLVFQMLLCGECYENVYT